MVSFPKLSKFEFHRFPKDRTWLEKVVRKFIIPSNSASMKVLFFSSSNSSTRREERLRKYFPIRWFLSETLPDFVNYTVLGRLKKVRNWLRYRTWDRYDIIKLDVPKDYHDPDYRYLHSCFQILVDFVEIELGCMEKANESLDSDQPPTSVFGKFFRKAKFSDSRYPEAGLKYLDWEISECSGPQGDDAKEKKELYLWWTKTRKLRVDPFGDPTIWRDTNTRNWFSSRNVSAGSKSMDIERFYEDEDQEMLERLTKIRRSIWL